MTANKNTYLYPKLNILSESEQTSCSLVALQYLSILSFQIVGEVLRQLTEEKCKHPFGKKCFLFS